MTHETFLALCDLAAQLSWSRQISKVVRKGKEETGWLDMTGCNILFKEDIDGLQAVIEKRERDDRKRLDAAAKKFVDTYLKFEEHD